MLSDPMWLALIGAVLILIMIKILTSPIKLVFKLLANAVSGYILLWFVNLLGSVVGLAIPYTWITVLVSGVFGMPGVVVLLLFRYIL